MAHSAYPLHVPVDAHRSLNLRATVGRTLVNGEVMLRQHIPLQAAFLAALLAPNRTDALRLVTPEQDRFPIPVSRIYLDVIAESQHEIGRLWQQNRITVAQEHIATGISQLALAQLYPSLPHTANLNKRVLVACVEGEQHELSARMVADFCEMEGFDVTFLGANLPTDSLIDMVARKRPDVVALSVTMTFNLPAMQRAVIGIDRVTGGTVPIVAGGQALEWVGETVRALPMTISTGDAASAAALLREVAASGTR